MFNKYKLSNVIQNSRRLTGFYNGVVVDASDPESKSRIKVEIEELTKGVESDLLPWYVVKQSFNASPNSQATIPPVGSEVVVEFPTDDIYNGLVSYVIVSSPP